MKPFVFLEIFFFFFLLLWLVFFPSFSFLLLKEGQGSKEEGVWQEADSVPIYFLGNIKSYVDVIFLDKYCSEGN